MSKKWLVDYQDNTKYPQVGPRDWMNKHGWYAKEGGPYVQGRDFDPNYQQYTQYGNMYSTPQFGLMYKPENTAMWGMGNSTNLIRSDYQGFSGSAPSTDYGYDRPTTGMVTGTTGQTNEDADYSVDSVRMKKGGTTKSQKKEYKAPVLVGPQGQWSNVHTFEGMPANPQRSDYEYQIEALQQRQANTTPIGAKPTWRNKAQRVINSVNNSAPGAYSAIPTMLTYPAQAALNLTDPSRYFQGTDGNAQAGFVGAGNMIMDASAVVPFLPKGRVPKVYGESNVAPHDSYSSIERIPKTKWEQIPIEDKRWDHPNWVGNTAKKNKGNTEMPYLTEYNPEDFPVVNKGVELGPNGYPITSPEGLPPGEWLDDIPGGQLKQMIQSELDPFDLYDELQKQKSFRKQKPLTEADKRNFDNIDKHNRLVKNSRVLREELPMFVTKNPNLKGEIFDAGFNPKQQTLLNKEHALNNDGYIDRDPTSLPFYYPKSYTDFGPKTPYQRMLNEEAGKTNQIPESLLPKVRQKNQYGGKVEQYKEGGTMKGKGWLNNFK